MDEKAHYKYLVERYVSRQASEEELAVFFKLASEGKLDNYLGETFNGLPKIGAKRFAGWKMLAAAAILVGVVSLVTFYITNSSFENDKPVLASTTPASSTNVATKRGEQRKITLPDGSAILLSPSSTVRYHSAFEGEKRIVELAGEGYFEVAHNDDKPFIVQMGNNVSIEVTGTQFLLSAFPVEKQKATLFEGSIKILSHGDSATLRPGQEASIQESGKLEVGDADVDKALALKSGILQFDGADVSSVMKQLERWFDITVEYEGEVPDRQLSGKIPINTNLNDVIKILQLSNVRCRLDGKKIVVLAN